MEGQLLPYLASATASAEAGFSRTTAAMPNGTLVADSEYRVWVVAADTRGNLQPAPTQLAVTTGKDLVPPSFVGNTPRLAVARDTAFNVTVSVSEGCVISYIGLPRSADMQPHRDVHALRSGDQTLWASYLSDSTPPNVVALLNAGVVPGVATHTAPIAGTATVPTNSAGELVLVRVGSQWGHLVHASTTYDMLFMLADTMVPPNVADRATLLTVTTTADVTPPAWHIDLDMGAFPQVQGVVGRDKPFQLVVRLSEAAAMHYVILPASATAPTAATLQGIDYNGTTPVVWQARTWGSLHVHDMPLVLQDSAFVRSSSEARVDIDPSQWDTSTTGSEYVVYAIAQDASGNWMQQAAAIPLTFPGTAMHSARVLWSCTTLTVV